MATGIIKNVDSTRETKRRAVYVSVTGSVLVQCGTFIKC